VFTQSPKTTHKKELLEKFLESFSNLQSFIYSCHFSPLTCGFPQQETMNTTLLAFFAAYTFFHSCYLALTTLSDNKSCPLSRIKYS
jgi:hypothetical protein